MWKGDTQEGNSMASREEVNAMIAAQIAADPAVRAEFMNDPRGALQKYSGMPVPEAVNVVVHEESPANIHIVIPASGEVSEADLALVAGGAPWTQNYSNGVNQDPY
jgi:hypothetical protein